MSSSQRLHPTTEAVYRFVVRFKVMYAGDSPTRREIAAGVGLASVSTVHPHLNALERAGRIRRPKRGKARMIEIPGAYWRVGGAVENGENKCAMPAGEEGAELPEEERKVRERLGEIGGRDG